MTVRQVLDDRKKELARKQAENDLLNRQMSEMEQRILDLVKSLEVGQEALKFLEGLANSRRGAMKGKIEVVVTEALRLIYGDTYRVELTYGMKNNRSSLEIEMVRDIPAGEVRRDIYGIGGGVSDTISVPLRLMVLVGSKQTEKVCILDECWKHQDGVRIEMVGQFLRALAEKLGMQVIFCTHHVPLRNYADKVYDVSENEGVSKVVVS
jgi:DNA repair exonuclease SbcCD ATPase subunit